MTCENVATNGLNLKELAHKKEKKLAKVVAIEKKF